MTIYFDMDGTLVDFYNVENWLSYLENKDTYPYSAARPLCNFSILARKLNQLQKNGYKIGIVSWGPKSHDDFFFRRVINAKLKYLYKHLKSVHWDEIYVVKYGTPKYLIVKDMRGILFDDEEKNRNSWLGPAYEPEKILSVLKELPI